MEEVVPAKLQRSPTSLAFQLHAFVPVEEGAAIVRHLPPPHLVPILVFFFVSPPYFSPALEAQAEEEVAAEEDLHLLAMEVQEA